MSVVGIDIGGTKIEAQVFDRDWTLLQRQRVATPSGYDGLVQTVAAVAAWARQEAGAQAPVGVSLAGVTDPKTGRAITANLPATGRPLQADLSARIGGRVAFLNDCHALTLSEARLGAGRGYGRVVGLILGTGVGGGVVLDGKVMTGHAGLAGEFGHLPISAPLAAEHGLPMLRCNCGRMGCYETLLSGPGLTRLAQRSVGRAVPPEEIGARRGSDAGLARVWSTWCDLAADLIFALIPTIDPQVIVLAGGLSRITGVAGDISSVLARQRFHGLPLPGITYAEGGDATGARGAALHALEHGGAA